MSVYDFYVTPEEYEQAEANGIDNVTLDRRVRLLGWSKKRAVSEEMRKFTRYGEWVQIAKKNGINKQTFYTRVRKGWELEEAATKKPNKHLLKGVHPKRRVISKEALQLAEKNGIPYATLYARIKRKGWDENKAASTPLMSASDSGKLGAAALEKREGRFHELIFK